MAQAKQARKSTTTKAVAKPAPAKKAKSAKAKTAKKKKAASGDGTIRSYVEERLLKTSDPYNKIVSDTLSHFDGAKTSQSSVRWYASRLRAAGVTVPDREVSLEQTRPA